MKKRSSGDEAGHGNEHRWSQETRECGRRQQSSGLSTTHEEPPRNWSVTRNHMSNQAETTCYIGKKTKNGGQFEVHENKRGKSILQVRQEISECQTEGYCRAACITVHSVRTGK